MATDNDFVVDDEGFGGEDEEFDDYTGYDDEEDVNEDGAYDDFDPNAEIMEPQECLKYAWSLLKAMYSERLPEVLNHILTHVYEEELRDTYKESFGISDDFIGGLVHCSDPMKSEIGANLSFYSKLDPNQVPEEYGDLFATVFTDLVSIYMFDWCAKPLADYVKNTDNYDLNYLNKIIANSNGGTSLDKAYFFVDRVNFINENSSIASVLTLPSTSSSVVLASVCDLYALIKNGDLKEVKDKEKETPKTEREVTEYDFICDDTVSDILSIYETLYADCFTEIPMGVLTSSGIEVLKSDGGHQADRATSIYAKTAYKMVANALDLGTTSFMGAVPYDAEEFLSKSSYPIYHLYNIMGRVGNNHYYSWKEFKEHGFVKKLKELVYTLFDSYAKKKTDFINFKVEVVHRMTTVVIVNEFKPNGMMSFSYHLTNSNGNGCFESLIGNRMHEILGKSTGMQISEVYLKNDVFRYIYVGDGDAYNKEILFAYKAYENVIASKTPVSSKNIILGKTLKDGMPYSINLESPQNIFTSILAGSGSGKGVLTLSILAGLLAAGHPVMYVDCKPDMSAMLWDMEREMNNPNCKILAVDALANVNAHGSRPVRDYPFGYKGDIFRENEELYSKLSIIPYLKSIQMSEVIAGLRSAGCNDFGNKKIFFIMDEAENANTFYDDFLKAIDSYKPPKAKGGQPVQLTPYDEAMKKLQYVFRTNINSNIRTVANTTGRQGLVGYIYIGQSTDPAAWKSGGEGDWKYTLFGVPQGKTSLKLMGRGIGSGSVYGLPKANYAGKAMMSNLGYWTISKYSKSGDDTASTAVKSYMVLNKNDFNPNASDFGGGYAAALLKNVTDDKTFDNITRNDLTMGDGQTVRESAGFYGLMKLICDGDETRLHTAMGSMYDIVDQVLTKSGIYSLLGYTCVEEYLYSADPASFFSVENIIEAYNKGGITPESSGTDEDAENGDYRGFGDDSDNVVEDEANSGDTDFPPPGGGFPPPSGGNAFPSPEGGFPPPRDRTTPNNGEGFGAGNPFEDEDFDEPPHNTGRDNRRNPTPTPTGNRQPYQTDEHKSPNNKTAYPDAYRPVLNINDSPFIYANGRLSSAYAFKEISKTIMDEITKAFGGCDRIFSVDIANSGLMVINNIQFAPQFNDDFIESLPVDIKSAVASGNVAELFYFDNLYKFHNLQHLSIENTRLAETRVRMEMSIGNQGWEKLFNKFPNLTELYIAGNAIRSGEEARQYEENGRAGFGLKEKLMSSWNMPDLSNSWVGRVWNSRPAGWAKKGLGYTLGIKALLTVAAVCGPWGVLFGALTVGTMVMDKKNNGSGNNSRR